MRKAFLWIFLLAVGVSASAQAHREEERNKAVAQSFFEDVLDQGHLERYSESHAAGFIAHTRTHDATLEEDLAAAREERKAMPDLHLKINEMMAERDCVFVRWTASGTNTRAGMGFPATGKSISIPGMTLFRFNEGKITEEWSVFDMLGVMEQAGLLPSRQ